MEALALQMAALTDRGQGLSDQHYRQLLDCAATVADGQGMPLITAMNGGAALPRVVVLPAELPGSVLAPSLIEEHLIPLNDQGRKGVVIMVPESLQAHKKRRANGGAVPNGMTYEGNGFPGRVNYLPSARLVLSIIGKRSATWRRLLHHTETHHITGYEVRRVVPAAVLPPPLVLSGVQVAADGTTTLHLLTAHHFSGARQLVTVAGFADDLDGEYSVVAASANSTSLRIKLPAAAAARVVEFQQRAQQGSVTVSEEQVLGSTWTLLHFMLTGQLEVQPAQLQQQQQLAAAADPYPPDVFPEVPLFDYQDGTDGDWQMMEELLGLAGGVGTPGTSLLLTQPGAISAASQEGQQEQPQQQQPSNGQPDTQPGSPRVSSSGHPVPHVLPQMAAALWHAQAEAHYCLLTVGSQQAVAGREGYRNMAMVVQGNVLVAGEITAQGLPLLSDAQVKEEVQLFDEAEKAVAIAADISTFMFRYKGAVARRLGVMAQQVREVLARHGALGTNIVKEDAQGLLTVDYNGLQVLLLETVKKMLADVEDVRQAQDTMQLTVMGRIEELTQQVERLVAAGMGGGDGTATAAVAAAGSASCSSRSTKLVGWHEEGDDKDSLAFRLEGGVVEISSGSSREKEAEGDENSAGELTVLNDLQAADWLMVQVVKQEGARNLYLNPVFKLSRGALWEVYQQTLRGQQEMTAAGTRPRSWGGQFIKLARKRIGKEKFRSKMQGYRPAPQALRGYQQRAVDLAATGHNMILVGPTGSGKTAITVAYSQAVLQADPAARIVFLAPTVLLVKQQTAVFLSWPSFQGGTFRVTGRTNDDLIAPRDWPRILEEFQVMVATPQLLLNMLEAGVAHFHQLVLLVLDECHHAQADHSMARVMRHYHSFECRTQVIGLTALPVSKATLDATYQDLCQLERNLDAQMCVLDEVDAELRAAVPAIEHHEVLVDLGPAEDSLGRRLGLFVVGAVEALVPALGLADVAQLPFEVTAMLRAGRWCTTAASWTVAAAEGMHAAAAAAAATTAAHSLDSSSQAKQPAAAAAAAVAAHRHDATNALLLVRAATAALALVSDVGFEAAVRYLSQEYYHVAATTSRLAKSVASSVANGDGMPLTAVLLEQLAQEVERADVPAGAYSLGSGTLSWQPKFQALKALLLSYREQESFHGIVFACTRDAVHSLTCLIAASPDLQFVEVYRLMGHGNRRQVGRSGGGMTSKEQRAVMQQFRQPGRRLLVSTSAGEEGIDVPRCEVVVRYTPTPTGRERVQSAGRARKMGSRFVDINKRTSAELALVHKSRREEDTMRSMLRAAGSLRI